MTEEAFQTMLAEINDKCISSQAAVAASVRGVLDEIDETVSGLAESCTGVYDEFSEAMVDLRDEMERSGDVLQQCRDAVDGLGDNADDALSALHDEHDAACDAADEAFETLEGSAQEVADCADELKAKIQQAIANILTEAMEAIRVRAEGPINDCRAQCVAKVQAVLDEYVHQVLADKQSEIVDQWLQVLRETIDGIVDQLRVGLVDFHTTVIEGSESAGEKREDTKLVMELLNEALAPLMRELERVTSLASSVGISLG